MNEHVKNICKVGQGHDCCRYMTVGSKGFECVKNTQMAAYIDSRVLNETITARGSNCEGKSIVELNSK